MLFHRQFFPRATHVTPSWGLFWSFSVLPSFFFFFFLSSLSRARLPSTSSLHSRRCTTMTGHHHTSPPLPKGAACASNPLHPISNQTLLENSHKQGRKKLELKAFGPSLSATSNLQNLQGFKALNPRNLVVSSHFNFNHRRRRNEVGNVMFRKLPAPISHYLFWISSWDSYQNCWVYCNEHDDISFESIKDIWLFGIFFAGNIVAEAKKERMKKKE